MTEHQQILRQTEVVAQFLQKHGITGWASELHALADTTEEQLPVQQLKLKIRKMFGGMGSLNDTGIYIANSVVETRRANEQLAFLLSGLYKLVNEPLSKNETTSISFRQRVLNWLADLVQGQNTRQ